MTREATYKNSLLHYVHKPSDPPDMRLPTISYQDASYFSGPGENIEQHFLQIKKPQFANCFRCVSKSCLQSNDFLVELDQLLDMIYREVLELGRALRIMKSYVDWNKDGEKYTSIFYVLLSKDVSSTSQLN